MQYTQRTVSREYCFPSHATLACPGTYAYAFRVCIDGVGVSGQEQGVGVQQLLEHQALIGIGTALILHADSHAFERGGGYEVEEHLGTAHPVEVVVDGFDRGLVGQAVEELEGADRGVHHVGGEDAFGNPMIESRSDITITLGVLLMCSRATDGYGGEEDR